MLTQCPRCKGFLDAALRCRRCDNVGHSGRLGSPIGKSSKWQQTTEGRIIIGVLLSLGFCFGLLQLSAAALKAINPEFGFANLPALAHLASFLVLQALALAAGGIVAGIGHPRGLILGALVGVISGLLLRWANVFGIVAALMQSLGSDWPNLEDSIDPIALYGQPILHAAFGALGGYLGRRIWKPIAPVETGTLLPGSMLSGLQNRAAQKRRGASDFPSLWVGPVAWLRVVLGTAVGVAGAIGTRSIIELFVWASEGKLKVMTSFEDHLTFAEIFSLSILLGGCVSGANTPNGLKQGVYMGLATATMMTGIFWSGALRHSMPGFFPVLSILLLAPVGGWFGSRLLPPLARTSRIKGNAWL